MIIFEFLFIYFLGEKIVFIINGKNYSRVYT